MEVTKKDLETFKREIKADLKKMLETKVTSEVKKQLKSKSHEDDVKAITSQVLVNLFRILWNRNSMWKKDI
jgi:hypothetical protein